MTRIPDELKEKIMNAQSAEEVAALLKPSGVDEALATQIWSEISTHRDDKELSPDELDAIAGGADRDWLTDGCAATVEPGSWCGSNDACHKWDVVYDHKPSKNTCPVCRINLYLDHEEHSSEITIYYRCIKCGYVKEG